MQFYNLLKRKSYLPIIDIEVLAYFYLEESFFII